MFNYSKPQLIAATLTGVSVGVLAFPGIPWVYKVVGAPVLGIPAAMLLLEDGQKFKIREKDLEIAIAATKSERSKSRELQKTNDDMIREIEQRKLLLSEKEEQLQALFLELEDSKNQLKLATKQDQDRFLLISENIIKQANQDAEAILIEAEAIANSELESATQKAQSLVEEYQSKLREVDKERDAIKIEFEGKEDRLKAEIRQQLLQLDTERSLLEKRMLDVDEARRQSEHAIALQQAEFAQKLQEARENFITEGEAEYAAKTQELEAENDALLTELEQALRADYQQKVATGDQELQETIEAIKSEFEQAYEDKLVPITAEINRLQKELNYWQSRYYQAQEKLNQQLDIRVADYPWSCEHKYRATQVQMWLKDRGIKVHYCSSSILPNGDTYFFFDPVLSGEKGKKAIASELESMIPVFGLQCKPELGVTNRTTEPWYLKLTPISTSLQGQTLSGATPFETSIKVPDSFLIQDDQIIEMRAKDRVDRQQRIDEMMQFRPQQLPLPKVRYLAKIEEQTVEWLCCWRALVVENSRNISDLIDLAIALYGCTEAKALERDLLMQESLVERLERIIQAIGGKVEQERAISFE